MDTRIDLDLLDRYLAGACTTRERADVERWLAADPRRSIAALKRGVSHESLDALGAPALVWHRVSRRIHALAMSQRQIRGVAPTNRSAWYTLAGLAMGAIAILIGWHIGSPRFTKSRSAAMTAYVTTNGQRANITLPDGSTVALDVASRLEVPVDYAAGDHTLRLSGEALFTVLHRAGTPFTVVAGGAPVRVLGTSFVVRHYPTDTKTTIAVRDGKVAVRSVVLAAAQQVVIDRGEVGEVQRANPAQFSFATGVLTLNSASFPDAVAQLDRWYDADIRADNPALLSQRVTGQYATGSIADLAQILEWTFNARVARNGRVLTLFPR